MAGSDSKLSRIFEVLEDAHKKGILHIMEIETEYVIRFNFAISKYEKSQHEEETSPQTS
jgi:hypothetical protein